VQNVPAAKDNKIKVRQVFNKAGHPYDNITWERRDAVIVGADSKEKFRQNGVEVPSWWDDNQTQVVAEKYLRVINGEKETSAKQMFSRVAGWISAQGVKQGVFTAEEGAKFELELLYLLANGMYAFNSPVWFNVGVRETPQCSACFIQSVDDTMESIVGLAQREVMLFKGGSGTGSNLSPLRSSYEKLSKGGRPSGPVSFMKGFDAFAGVTKSGGGTRRAAKMVVLNIDHPDILESHDGQPGFITCKSDAEEAAHALFSTGKYTAEFNKPGNVYDRVGYQNANNSVRVTDDFMEKVVQGSEWQTKEVKSGKPVRIYQATHLWEEIAKAAWVCGDPGIQFDTSTNDMHTCPNSGRINASNPCSEYLFLDDTACNLGSLNLLKFIDGPKGFKLAEFEHACEITTIAKEIIVDASSYPSKMIADNSHEYRTLGLGYTNVGALLTYWGLPYDSHEARAVIGAITAVMTGAAYKASADLARVQGPFPAYEKNKDAMIGVIRKHWDAAKRLPSLMTKERQVIVDRAYEVWQEAHAWGLTHGFRNAQVTVIAPTGTISFLMGADTTGIEPMLGVVVYKKLVGEGLVILVNGVVEKALKNLGYSAESLPVILDYIKTKQTIHGAPGFDPKHSAVFAEALGERALRPEAHIDMMVAVQPFISGGISKTVNMPATATVKEVADIYMRAWKGRLKCVAIYRDGCKLSQPIGTTLTDRSGGKGIDWGQRKKLPKTRDSKTHKFSVGNLEGYLIPGLYPDGTLGEIFVEVSKQGSSLMGLVDCWAQAVSIGLQHGVPFEVLREKFVGMKFDPSGITEDAEVRFATSLPDFVFRWLEHNIINKNKKTEAAPTDPPVLELVPMPRTKSSEIPKKFLEGPPCANCGNLTQRSGSCFCCPECGSTTGCS
jgi:ribonucleoside-diphosphate reductase alpha chain